MSHVLDDRSFAVGGRALVIHPVVYSSAGNKRSAEARLEEIVGLAKAIALDVVYAEAVTLRQPSPATLLGGGKVVELAERVESDAIELIVVDGALTPIQQRNLERACKAKVIDRTGLILEIFGERAATREGRLQVELAALSYARSRLVRSWTHLERQRGGLGFVGGPGESQIEIDRRRIDERIVRLKKDLEDVRRTRGLHRSARERVPYPVVALVGYTNAGKSTLFNRLTGASVMAEDLLFATLDPTMRAVRLPSGRQVIVSDTVGFISDLPTTLVAAFRATLEEVRSADLIVHVRAIDHPDHEAQAGDVREVLCELELDEAWLAGHTLEFWNKADALDAPAHAMAHAEAERQDDVVLGAALSGESIDQLVSKIDAKLSAIRCVVDVTVPAADGEIQAWLHRRGEVLHMQATNPHVCYRVALDPVDLTRLEARRHGHDLRIVSVQPGSHIP
ncbi:MAG: GTPase HflX [Geminicoccaceae bacterium]